MKHIKCIVCKNPLPSNSEDSICDRNSCKNVIETRELLIERIRVFKEFFTGKPVTDAVYKEYFEMVGLEPRYRNFCWRDEDKTPKMSRRVWFQLNIGQGHHEWADEFGRSWQGVENE